MNPTILFFSLISIIFLSVINANNMCKKDPYEKDAKKFLPFLFNISLIKEATHNYDYFRLYLKESNEKGIGIYASKVILKNRTIMYYKLKVFEKNKYVRFNNGKYSFVVYINSCQKDYDKIADIYKNSNSKPKARKPFWVLLKLKYFLEKFSN